MLHVAVVEGGVRVGETLVSADEVPSLILWLASVAMPAPAYTCKACGLGVLVQDGQPPLRVCACQAPIVAACEATMHGSGGLAG